MKRYNVTGRVELTINAENLEEASLRFRQIILSCKLKSSEELWAAVPHTFESVEEKKRRYAL